ncbi:MAG: hypothetical protein RL685_3184 [Pseudomonadota bacterium]|jgi:catechol 2,3-dioxygenase-like lactoylglutathione lyase family enzyme
MARAMIDHTGLKVSNPAKSRKFYDQALAPLGYAVLMDLPKEHTGGIVVLGYRAAIAAGGKDNGPPGPRPHYHANYYGAFVLDPDGHNIEAVCHTPA